MSEKQLIKSLLSEDNYLDFREAVLTWVRSHSPPPVKPDKSGYISEYREMAAQSTMHSMLIVGLVSKYPEIKEHAKKIKELLGEKQ